MSEKIRVVIADDEEGYRKALRQILSHTADIDLVGVAKDGVEALELVEEHDADVLLTDIDMPRMDGIECIAKLSKNNRDVTTFILTVHADNDKIFDAIRAGAMGYMLKTSTPEEVVNAIRKANNGEAALTPSIAAKVLEDFRRQKDDEEIEDEHLYELSPRELEILEFVTQGLRNKEIAEKLFLAEKTVKNHVSNILKALHVNSRTEAAMKAIKERLVGD